MKNIIKKRIPTKLKMGGLKSYLRASLLSLLRAGRGQSRAGYLSHYQQLQRLRALASR